MEKIDIDLADIFEYIKSSRPIKEGEAVYNAGHITLCGLKDSDSTKLTEIVGFCLQTSNLSGPPHKVEINIHKDVNQWNAKCSCKAGLGEKCKHIAGVLIYVNSNKQLEKLSCTDLEQIWGKSGQKQSFSKDGVDYSAALKMVDYCHPVVKKIKLVPETNMDEINKGNREILQQVLDNTNTGYFKMLEGRKVIADIDLTKFHSFDFIKEMTNQQNAVLNEISVLKATVPSLFYNDKIKNADTETI